jgi:Virulence-associated protein E
MQTAKIDADYLAHVERLIGMLAQNHALGREIDISMCVSGLEPNRLENRKVRDFVTRGLKMNGRDFDRALHLETVRMELGILPKTSREFVEAFTTTKRISAHYNGLLKMDEVPYITKADGSRDYIAPDLWDSYDFKTMIRTTFKRTIGFAEIQQALRVRAAELRLDFSPAMLNDASELWYADICRNRLWMIMGTIDYSDSLDIRTRGQANLRHLAETCFDCPEGTDFAIAVFNKFIWQVKRKIEDMPIYDHLMPVILGPQGAGKSTLIRKLLQPVEELWVMTDFKQMTDNRNISLWRNFVIFLDEMGWASKADIDIVKNIISAATLTRRVMWTNATQEVAQNVTFIGAANAFDLAELIRDPTGIRRFVSLTMCAMPDREMINSIDWRAVWQSVDHTAEDPMTPFRTVLSGRQEKERIKTPVEDWLDHIDGKTAVGGATLSTPGRRFRSADLHTMFREFEDLRFPGLLKTSLPSFIREMRRLAKVETARFSFIDDKGYILWEWRGTK